LLTIVLSYAELLNTQYGAVEALSGDLKRISDAAGAASKITDDLLTFSGGRPTQIVQFELDRALTSIGTVLRALGDTVPVHVAAGAPGAWIKFGQAEFESVLLNLVKNAKEAAVGNGGSVTVSTSRLNPGNPEDMLLLRHLQLPSGSFVTMDIRDSGAGFAAEHGAAVFEPFFSTKPGAVGLGLSTVYGMVKRAGGRMSIEPLPDAGTLCRVVLPEAQNPPE
jgi:two-component system cell cycle sensor histidine kinase/response regulator CckA